MPNTSVADDIDDLNAIKQLAAQVAEERYAPLAAQWDAERTTVPVSERQFLGSLGLLGIALPEEFGGSVAPISHALAVIEQFAYHNRPAAFQIFEANTGPAQVVAEPTGLDLDVADLPEWGAFKDVKGAGRGVPAPADQQGRRRGGNVVVAPSMVRPEYAYLNPHLLAERGGPALRVHPEDAAAHGLSDGDDVRLRVDGLWRRASVRVTDAVPVGMMTIPATPDQPQGLAHADLSSLAVLRDREAVAS